MNPQDGHYSQQPPPSPSNGGQQQNYQQQVQIFPGGVGSTTPPNQPYQHQQLRVMRMTPPPGAMRTNMMQWDQPIQTQPHYMTQTITRIHTTRMIVPTANSNIGVPGTGISFRPRFRMVRLNQNQGSRVTGLHAITDGSLLLNQTPQGLFIYRRIRQPLQNAGSQVQPFSPASPCPPQNQQLHVEKPVSQPQPLEPTPTVILQPPRFRAPSHSQSVQMITPLIGQQSTSPGNGSQGLQRLFLRPAQFNANAVNNVQLSNVSSGSGGYQNPRSPVVSVSPVMTPSPPYPPASQQVNQLGLGQCDITTYSNAEPTQTLKSDQKPLSHFSGEVRSGQRPLIRPSRFTVDWRSKQPVTSSAPTTNQDNKDGNNRSVNTATKPQSKPVATAANPKKRKAPVKDVPIVSAAPDLNDNQPKNDILNPNAIAFPASSVSQQKKKTKTVAEVAKEVKKDQPASTFTSFEISEKKVGGAKKQAATGEGVPKEQDDSRYFTEATATTPECIKLLILGELKQASGGSSVFNKAVRVKVNRKLCQPSGIFVFDVSILEKDSQSSDYPPVMLQVTKEYPADVPVFLDFQAIAKTISNKRNRQRFEEAVKRFKWKIRGLHESQLRIHLLICVWSWALMGAMKLPQSYFNGKSQKKKMESGFLDQLMPTPGVKNDDEY